MSVYCDGIYSIKCDPNVGIDCPNIVSGYNNTIWGIPTQSPTIIPTIKPSLNPTSYSNNIQSNSYTIAAVNDHDNNNLQQ